MTRTSLETWLALAGLVVLLACVQISGFVRQGDWSAILDFGGWFSALFIAAFMGSWGWLALLVGCRTASRTAGTALAGLAILYFATMAYFTVDIILHGNSTAALAFFFLPAFATVIMLPLIAAIGWVGRNPDGSDILRNGEIG